MGIICCTRFDMTCNIEGFLLRIKNTLEYVFFFRRFLAENPELVYMPFEETVGNL